MLEKNKVNGWNGKSFEWNENCVYTGVLIGYWAKWIAEMPQYNANMNKFSKCEMWNSEIDSEYERTVCMCE